MSLPLPANVPAASVAAIRAATRLAGSAAARIGQAVNFDEVLRSGQSSEPSTVQVSTEELGRRLETAIAEKLSAAGIQANPKLRLKVQQDAGLSVLGDHPRAAEIEALLSGDAELTELVKRFRDAGGRGELIIGPQIIGPQTSDLTSHHGEATLPGPPGGYANWLAD